MKPWLADGSVTLHLAFSHRSGWRISVPTNDHFDAFDDGENYNGLPPCRMATDAGRSLAAPQARPAPARSFLKL
jgi:hypothetical protein